MEPIAADEMVIEYVGQNIRQVRLQPLTLLRTTQPLGESPCSHLAPRLSQ